MFLACISNMYGAQMSVIFLGFYIQMISVWCIDFTQYNLILLYIGPRIPSKASIHIFPLIFFYIFINFTKWIKPKMRIVPKSYPNQCAELHSILFALFWLFKCKSLIISLSKTETVSEYIARWTAANKYLQQTLKMNERK